MIFRIKHLCAALLVIVAFSISGCKSNDINAAIDDFCECGAEFYFKAERLNALMRAGQNQKAGELAVELKKRQGEMNACWDYLESTYGSSKSAEFRRQVIAGIRERCPLE